MDSIVNKTLTLTLNKFWLPVGVTKVRDAFKNYLKGTHKALHVTYPIDEEGKEIYGTPTYMNPVTFPEWVDLEGRRCDRWISTGSHESAGGKVVENRIRIPTILLSLNCEENLISAPPYSPDNIRIRDNNTCQYTGRKLDRKLLNIDHVVPQSKGGETSWENCVLCDKSINSKKGDMSLSEFKKKKVLTLLSKPRAPSPKSMAYMIKNTYDIPDWDIFLVGK